MTSLSELSFGEIVIPGPSAKKRGKRLEEDDPTPHLKVIDDLGLLVAFFELFEWERGVGGRTLDGDPLDDGLSIRRAYLMGQLRGCCLSGAMHAMIGHDTTRVNTVYSAIHEAVQVRPECFNDRCASVAELREGIELAMKLVAGHHRKWGR